MRGFSATTCIAVATLALYTLALTPYALCEDDPDPSDILGLKQSSPKEARKIQEENKEATFSHKTATDIVMAIAGISPDSKIAERFHQKLTNPKGYRKRKIIPTQRKVIKHLRFEDGIPLPTEKEIAALKDKPLPRNRRLPEPESYRNRVKEYLHPGEKKIDRKKLFAMTTKYAKERTEMFTPKELVKCRQGKTLTTANQTRTPSFAQDSDSELLFDVLYLPPGAPNTYKMTTGADELFGKKTFVNVYSTEEGDFPSLMASTHKVPCLPFRLRVTNSKIYRHYGIDALKNFDISPKGRLHNIVKEKIYDFS